MEVATMSADTLTPNASPRHLLGAELRRWRQTRGLSITLLAAQVYVSRELLQKVETAHRNAGADLIAACDTVLNTGGALARLLDFAMHQERERARQTKMMAPAPPSPSPPAVTPPVVLRVTITTEVVPLANIDHAAHRVDADAGESVDARIYPFPPALHSGERP
jgi:hypothetical protein